MKNRVNIRGFFFADNLDVRPSLAEKIDKALTERRLDRYDKLCKCSESQLEELPIMTPDIMVLMKNYLASVGLHLGMTDHEMMEYMDAEYVQTHHEQKEDIPEFPQELIKSILEKKTALEDKTYVHQPRGYIEDIQWSMYHLRLQLFLHQPWYMKLFCSSSCRLKAAKEQARRMYDGFCKDLISIKV